MKLKDLKESISHGSDPDQVLDAISKHLVIEIVPSSVSVIEIFIIEDVPRISKTQFRQLLRLSFEKNSFPSYLTMDLIHDFWVENKGDVLKDYYKKRQAKIFIVDSWKEFVTYVKKEFPPVIGDDFSD